MSFWCLQFSQKTNENNLTWGTIVVKSNFFVRFLGEFKIPKRHFEFNWPLLRQQTSQKLLLIGWKKSRRLKFPSNEHTTVRQKTGRNLIGLNIRIFFPEQCERMSYPETKVCLKLPFWNMSWSPKIKSDSTKELRN